MTTPIVILHTDNAEAAHKVLAGEHPDLEIHTCDSYDALPGMISETGAEVVFSVRFDGTRSYPRAALVESDQVKWVSVGGSGTDHLASWDADRVTVTNAAGVAADMMAQYALWAILNFSLNMPVFRAAQARQDWISGEVEPIDGKTVLILGLGKTGAAVAARAKALDMRTIGVRARPQPTPCVDEVFGLDDLAQLWPRADFIVVCVPLLDTTRGLVGPDAIAAMKSDAVIVDVSRGGVIDEAALLSALQTHRIKGAALDVFATEPLPKGHKYWSLENAVLTPHCSAVYDGWDLKSVQMFAENLTRYRRGEALLNVVDPNRGY
ncbi:MAG: D-2-hydroxyacid dehydrogenase [Pseudomonadota bacterium]